MAGRNRVLYLSYDGLTDPLGQSQILPYLTGLARDYQITIISFEKNISLHKNGSRVKKICDQHAIEWHPLAYHKSPPVLSTLYDLWALRRTSKKLQKRNSFAIVHCRSYLTALVGLWMKKAYKVRFIFDMRGFWADERVEGRLWNLKNPLYKIIYTFFKRREQAFLNQADHTVVLTHAASRQLTTWHVKSPVTIIPCCVDLDFFDPDKINAQRQQQLRTELGIQDSDYIVCYIGSLGTWYMYDEMVLFFDCLKKIHPAARMLFLTPDAQRVLRKDFIVKSIARSEVPDYLGLCNASVCFVRPTFSKTGSSATKMAEAMAMGIPLIVNSGWGDVEEVVNAETGVITTQSGENELTAAAKKLLSKNFRHDVIRQAAFNYFSLEKGIESYRKIYNGLSGPI